MFNKMYAVYNVTRCTQSTRCTQYNDVNKMQYNMSTRVPSKICQQDVRSIICQQDVRSIICQQDVRSIICQQDVRSI